MSGSVRTDESSGTAASARFGSPGQRQPSPTRDPDTAGRLDGLQVLRGMAALAVVAHHALEEAQPILAPAAAKWLVTVGAAGVDLFFVLSGFIMLYTAWGRLGRAHAAREFLWRRALRILPLYWFCTTLVLVARASGLAYKSIPLDAPTILGSYLLLPRGLHLVAVAWTLVYEALFYLVFAAWMACSSARLFLFGVVVSMLALHLVGVSLGDTVVGDFLSNRIVAEFCLGLLLAYAARRGHRLPGGPWAVAGALGGFVAGAIFAEGNTTSGIDGSVRFLVWGLPAMLAVSAAARAAPRSTASTAIAGRAASAYRRAAIVLGDSSYSLYLSHGFVMIALAKLIVMGALPSGPLGYVCVGLAMLASVGLGIAMYHVVEQPLIARTRSGRSTRSIMAVR